MIRTASICIAIGALALVILATGQMNSGYSASDGHEATAVALPTPTTARAVCSDPTVKCDHRQKHFDEWELPFKMPAKLAANKPYSSAPFYAVMLKTYELDDDCDGGEYVIAFEKERKKVQKLYPERKVFSEYQCPNMSAVGYEFEGKMDAKRENVLIGNFLAIYAGTTKAEADELLTAVKAKYPKAVIKRMTATYELIVQ